jgi:hypothetical protein
VSYHDESQRKLSRKCGAPALLERSGGIALTHKMWTPSEIFSSTRRRRWQRWSEIQPNPFAQVYNFILQAVQGDKATADAIFEDYLAGKVSEELLSISRRWVSADQAGSSKREIERDGAAQRQSRAAATNVGVCDDDAFTAVA